MARIKLLMLLGFLAGMALAGLIWEAGRNREGGGGHGVSHPWAESAGGVGQAVEAGDGTDWKHAVHSPAAPDRPANQPDGTEPAGVHFAGSRNREPEEPKVRVYLTEERRTETVPLEVYVMGVVAAEMTADFPQEALEAQALAARTYIIRRLVKGDRGGLPEEAAHADVTDATTHQRYRTLEEMRRMREDNPDGWEKVRRAVEATRGKVLVYDGEPIQALYFSTSNGYTEASEEVFSFAVPYLRSVESPWDRSGAPRSKETTEMALTDFYRKLGIKAAPAAIRKGGAPKLRVAEWTQGRRVRTLQVGDLRLAGTEVREKLGLRSTAFSWKMDGGRIAITTRGSGHGVGMSQWGARFMAEEGYTAEQIVKHYYTGVAVEEVSKLWSPAESFPSL
ncbi:MAG TPA: stage II sporulation protein D [Paenibacillaceae bacterium]